jgi:hypothetical protein
VLLERLDRATVQALRERLLGQEYHVLHFIGHGDVDPATGRGLLLFEGDRGPASEPRRVNGDEKSVLFNSVRPPRLMLLNSCSGARATTKDVFIGMAQTLVQHGIAAVIAMQCPVTDSTAITFAPEFYRGLAENNPIDRAVWAGRQAVYMETSKTEWATPALFLNTTDARLFEVTPVSDDARAAMSLQGSATATAPALVSEGLGSLLGSIHAPSPTRHPPTYTRTQPGYLAAVARCS